MALVVSALAVPIVYLLQVRVGSAPPLGTDRILLLFVLPYPATAALAYVAARVVHQLGVEVRRAHQLGSYRLDALLGRGGMGEVWRASHRMLARPAAIKAFVHHFGPLTPERVVYLLRQACSSLAEAHHRGLVHRDIKPANISCVDAASKTTS